MGDKLNLYKTLLSYGADNYQCLFCYGNPDTFIVRGATKEHSFKLPFSSNIIKKLIITYVQNGKIILEKTLDDIIIAEFDNNLIYYILKENETLKFSTRYKCDVQLKILLEDGSIITSQEYIISIIDSLDHRRFNETNKVYNIIDAYIDNQEIVLNEYSEVITGSNNLYECTFYFDSSWDDFTKYALFKDEYNHLIKVDIDQLNNCIIPSDVIEKPGYVYIGVIGENSECMKPTMWSNSIKVPISCNLNFKEEE